jgi:hypothetical protein
LSVSIALKIFSCGLKFLQRDGSVTIAIHQSEDEAHGGSSW